VLVGGFFSRERERDLKPAHIAPDRRGKGQQLPIKGCSDQLPKNCRRPYQQGMNSCPRQNFQSSSSSPLEDESGAISAAQRQNAQNYAVEPLQLRAKSFAVPMVVYRQALEHLRAESVALKPKRSMDLKHAQRVPNLLWV